MLDDLQLSRNDLNHDIFSGGGEMGARMRAFDWSTTPVGPTEDWPQSLKSAVNTLLNSAFGMFLWWGPELIQFYNDAYRPSLGQEGEKHPGALGQRGEECWGEIWPIIYPQIEQVMTKGIATWNENALVPIYRNGILEEVYWTYSYSPVFDESGKIGGVLVVEAETTKQVIGERELNLLRLLAAETANAPSVEEVYALSGSALEHNPYDLPFALLYLADEESRTFRLAGRSGIHIADKAAPETISFADNSLWPAMQVLETGKPVSIPGLEAIFGQLPAGAWDISPQQAIALPIAQSGETGKTGILIVGLNPFRLFDDRYRTFINLIAGQIASSVARAHAHEEERKVADERKRLHDVLMQAPAIIAVLRGPSHVVEFVNPLYMQLVGVGRDVIGKTILEALPEIEEQGFIELLDNVYKTGKPFMGNEIPAMLARKEDGQLDQVYLNFVYQPYADAEGKIPGILLHAVDVTEQVRARQHIEESEERFRLLADNIAQFAWVTDENGAVIWYNNRWYDYTGTTLEEMRGWGWQKVHHPDHVERVVANVTHHFEIGEAWEDTFPLRGKDRLYRWFLTQVIPIKDKDGKVLRWFGTNTDVTEQRESQEALRISESRFKALAEGNIIGVMTANLQGSVLDANSAFLNMIDHTMEEVQQGMLRWDELTPPEYVEVDKALTADLVAKGSAGPLESEYIRKDGTRIPVIIGGTMVNNSAKEATIFVLDITERKKLEQRKDDFISLASHELRTPITILKMRSHLLKKRFEAVGDDATIKQLVGIDLALGKLNELVGSLLDVARIEAGKVEYHQEDFRLDGLITEVAEDLQRLSESHTLIVQGDEALVISADKDRMRQVLINLINNATKYSPSADKVIISSKLEGNEIIVAVQDFGIGIAENEQGKIFDRFFQVSGTNNDKSNIRSGLGLGLYICSEIIKRHGGKIWLESKIGEGTTFYFMLPAQPGQNS